MMSQTDLPGDDELRRILSDGQNSLPVYVTARTFLKKWESHAKPVALRCDDGNDYVVKGKQAGRVLFNDQVVARLGLAMSAPVGRPNIVMVPKELVDNEKEMSHVTPGLAHATLLIPNCSEKLWLQHLDVDANRPRFASIAVLYGWCAANDHQLIYSDDSDKLVYSVDHGHFFPGGPDWKAASLATLGRAEIYPEIVKACDLKDSEIAVAKDDLRAVTIDDVFNAIRISPDDWGVPVVDRIALTKFLVNRYCDIV